MAGSHYISTIMLLNGFLKSPLQASHSLESNNTDDFFLYNFNKQMIYTFLIVILDNYISSM